MYGKYIAICIHIASNIYIIYIYNNILYNSNMDIWEISSMVSICIYH